MTIIVEFEWARQGIETLRFFRIEFGWLDGTDWIFRRATHLYRYSSGQGKSQTIVLAHWQRRLRFRTMGRSNSPGTSHHHLYGGSVFIEPSLQSRLKTEKCLARQTARQGPIPTMGNKNSKSFTLWENFLWHPSLNSATNSSECVGISIFLSANFFKRKKAHNCYAAFLNWTSQSMLSACISRMTPFILYATLSLQVWVNLPSQGRSFMHKRANYL